MTNHLVACLSETEKLGRAKKKLHRSVAEYEFHDGRYYLHSG